MSRIRTVHPSLFTDEAFMMATPVARLFIIGLWTEAFDDGVFEWKPKTLKAKLFPCDNINPDEILAELEGLAFIKRFESGGRSYGAIRNFCAFQRPKKPNSSGVVTADIRLYVRMGATSCEPVPHQIGTGEEKSPQMEDGGGNRKERDSPPDSSTNSPPASLVDDPSPPLSELVEQTDKQFLLAVGELWNELAAELSLPQIENMDAERKRAVRARARDFKPIWSINDPMDGFRVLSGKIRGSPLLRGEVGAWRCTFDWVMAPKNFKKIMENNFEDRKAPAKSPNGGQWRESRA